MGCCARLETWILQCCACWRHGFWDAVHGWWHGFCDAVRGWRHGFWDALHGWRHGFWDAVHGCKHGINLQNGNCSGHLEIQPLLLLQLPQILKRRTDTRTNSDKKLPESRNMDLDDINITQHDLRRAVFFSGNIREITLPHLMQLNEQFPGPCTH